jgi:hypothetical protein
MRVYSETDMPPVFGKAREKKKSSHLAFKKNEKILEVS